MQGESRRSGIVTEQKARRGLQLPVDGHPARRKLSKQGIDLLIAAGVHRS
jgi:hypothetical protein